MKGLEINNSSSEENDDVADLEILFGNGNGSYELVAEEGSAETGDQESTSKRDTNDGENIAYSNALQLQLMQKSDNNDALRQHTHSDESLKVMRDLAMKELNGYRWKDLLVLRERYDDLGRVSTQICAPIVVRNKKFILAHEKFGHQHRNKVVHHVQKRFYWPSLWKMPVSIVGHAMFVRGQPRETLSQLPWLNVKLPQSRSRESALIS